MSKSPLAAEPSLSNEKQADFETPEKDPYSKSDVESTTGTDTTAVLRNERDLVTHVISVHDDPSLNPWTFRAFFIGIGLSAFGGVLVGNIPILIVGLRLRLSTANCLQSPTMFLAIISYVLGIAMEGPFNKKENAFIVLAVQRLFYNITPNGAASIFLLFSSQLLGFGIGGLMRPILLYPSKMLYPGVLPLVSMFDAFYQEGNTRKIFIWEIFPEWMFPLLTGFSIFCLANPRSTDFTRVFGGSNGNEGLGLLSICFDWQYISGGVNPFAIPLRAQVSNFIGYILCMVVFVAVYYNNIWESKNFPFLSQELFYENGTVYDQLLILNDKLEVDPTLVAEQGLPFYAGTWITYLLTSNIGMAATFTHLLLWNRNDLRGAWSWASKGSLKRMWAEFNWRIWEADGKREISPDDDIGPPLSGDAQGPFLLASRYPDAPNSWYGTVLAAAFVTAMVIIYKTDSTLPWWGFIIACLLATLSILFFGSLYAMTGLTLIIQPFIQMIGGFLHPGKPMANMYFVLFGYNSVTQAQLLLRDLKIAQYTKLAPRAAFTAQIIGTLFGSILNYIMMNSIIDNQRDILLSVQGTNIWSGQQPQQYNSQSIAWGGLPHELFAHGKRYQWVAWGYVLGLFVPVPFWLIHRYFPKVRADYLYTPVIAYYIGWLCVGINSSVTSYFAIAWLSQWYLRTRYPRWFAKYNYILGAALDGGTQVMVFILSFAWWGANQNGNYDRCARVD
ncbi:OPT oligopeptide transporter protein-domain-containing protein [Lactarius deliciosus]|nr:OPT oligopeptide transporter protein-domain-containing protein [Lactarius deliciosus]